MELGTHAWCHVLLSCPFPGSLLGLYPYQNSCTYVHSLAWVPSYIWSDSTGKLARRYIQDGNLPWHGSQAFLTGKKQHLPQLCPPILVVYPQHAQYIQSTKRLQSRPIMGQRWFMLQDLSYASFVSWLQNVTEMLSLFSSFPPESKPHVVEQ